MSARFEARAEPVALSTRKIPAARIEQALRDVRRARAWQPDTGPRLLEERLLLRSGRVSGAEAVLADLTRAEPENAEAWYRRAFVTQDRRVRREAVRRFRALTNR